MLQKKQKPFHSLEGEKGLQVYDLLVPRLISVISPFASTSEVYTIRNPTSMVMMLRKSPLTFQEVGARV
jgi:hypothetical protein